MNTPFMFILFGSTGDLAQKKIMPALFKLYAEGQIGDGFTIVAFSRRPWNDQQYRDFIKPALEKARNIDQSKLTTFLEHVVYSEGHFTEPEAYQKLEAKITEYTKPVKLFYLSVQPEFYQDILTGLSQTQLLKDPQTKIMVEKPFGHDATSATALEKEFEKVITPEQLLRVDHYLAKEGLEKLIQERKTNSEFENMLNAEHVQSIHARMLETIGIEGRGEFYERIGAIVDVGQNHVMEMLATIMMDLDKDKNTARTEVLNSLTFTGTPILGQYDRYKDEEEVDANSNIETYFKLTFTSSLPRWKGVTLIIEGGKAMAEKKSDITVLKHDGSQIVFDIDSKLAGRDAYEILIEEALNNNDDYFVSLSEVVAAWNALDPVLKSRATLLVKPYPKNSNGPML
jgi:glucose-6-phosphate 1-dehydrogenase